ncbi:MAG: PEP-CTERM sorting domain-containing protein [Gemmataceae bacterium]
MALATCTPGAWAGAFGANNLAVVAVQTGGTIPPDGNAQQVSILEYKTSGGAAVQTITVTGLTQSNSQGLEGSLDLSANGRYLSFAGYNAAVGTGNVAGSVTTGTGGVLRVVGRIDVTTGVPNLSTTTTDFSKNSFRAAASSDGSRFWMGGASQSNDGFRTTTFGHTGSATLLANQTTGALHVFTNLVNNQVQQELYGVNNQTFGAASIFKTTPSLPDGSGPTSIVPVVSGLGQAAGFVFLDQDNNGTLDTLYVADQLTGLRKFVLTGGLWTARGTATGLGGLTGVTGVVNGANNINLFVTTGNGTAGGNTLQRFTDIGGTNNISGGFTLLATAASGTVFRGVAIVPEPGSLLLGGAACLGFAGMALRRYRNRVAAA